MVTNNPTWVISNKQGKISCSSGFSLDTSCREKIQRLLTQTKLYLCVNVNYCDKYRCYLEIALSSWLCMSEVN